MRAYARWFLSCGLGWALALTLVACSYTNRRADISLGSQGKVVVGAQRIFIPTVDNLTTRPGIEAALTNALRNTLATVKDVQMVNRAEDAQYLLLGTVVGYDRHKGGGVTTGSSGTEAEGGLSEGQTVATDIQLRLDMKISFLEKIPASAKMPEEMRRSLWTRMFTQEAIFEMSHLYTEVQGSSTAPHINESREMLQLRIMGENLAKQVVDQLVQDF